ncbi:hypothetical protein OGAPHI_004612 [Ogataea philodendri]|uniref:Uncharacterized protein n=1 Tax=Ogataea philodendri TaxID=1378263 RepID=A0A9P8P2Y1_9ASCO|nr:uncharacterized protein OGAPHI_004612 [Ogataea philodendri]KAH3664260.1 hypothetical protein OGAPHI_004612 [Ogataea philodendri]
MLIASDTLKLGKHFASVLLSLKPSEAQRSILHKHLVNLNDAFMARYNDMQKGYFNNVTVPFNLETQPIYPFELPYGGLIRGQSELALKNRLIEPQMLNLKARWPTVFYNDFLYSDRSTYHVHVSLTPIVLYESDSSIIHYKREFSRLCKGFRESGKHRNFPLRLDGKATIFSRIDYQRLFLALYLDKDTTERLDSLCGPLNKIRFSQPDIGYVNGEQESDPVKKLDHLHLSLGMSVIRPKPFGNFPFGMYELFYLNNVLLLPKEQLLKKYPEHRALNFISDVKTELDPQELDILQFESSRLVCSLDRGELWEDL